MKSLQIFHPRPAPKARPTEIFYDRQSYCAFPHVIQLEGEELLIAFRQAPKAEIVKHSHPRSVITVIRSYNHGETWETEGATQLAAGGGQELGLIYLGKGKVGGALAAHEIVPVNEAQRAGFSHANKLEYPSSIMGTYWCWSDNSGLIWRLENATLVSDTMVPCAPPVKLHDGTLIIPAYCAIGRSKVSSAVLYRSEDEGKSWSDMTVIARGRPSARGYGEPALMELEPGHILCLLRTGGERIFWQNESFDNGNTWTAPRPTHILSGTCPRLLMLQDGRLLLTYGRRFDPYGIYASLSEDDGKSWSETCWLLRKARDGDLGYTSSIQLDSGRIFTTSYAKNAGGTTGIIGIFWDLP